MKRREQRKNRSRNEEFSFEVVDQHELELLEGINPNPLPEELDISQVIDNEWQPEEEDIPKKKRRFVENLDNAEDDLPYKYRHIREGPRSVKDEVYQVITILQSKFHLSNRQAEGAIITVANKLFGREKFGEWKPFKLDAVS